MQLVDQYTSNLEDSKQEWVSLMVNFMRDYFPELEEYFDYKMPTYKGNGYFIAFAAQKQYFSFYTDAAWVLPLIKELVPSTSLGKGCARIQYSHTAGIDALMDACKEIVDYHKSQQSSTVSDLEGLKKWKRIPEDAQKRFLSNVFCTKCGVTTIVDYGIHNDRFGLVLKGYCMKCGGVVARFVENE